MPSDPKAATKSAPDKFVVMRADMTEHSRHATMEAATKAMAALNERGMFLKLEDWR